MPIRKHLTDKTAFGPAAIEAMSKAFEGACTALRVYAGDEKGREIIAARIIDVARTARPLLGRSDTCRSRTRGANRVIGSSDGHFGAAAKETTRLTHGNLAWASGLWRYLLLLSTPLPTIFHLRCGG
jgi:hypothetical protein